VLTRLVITWEGNSLHDWHDVRTYVTEVLGVKSYLATPSQAEVGLTPSSETSEINLSSGLKFVGGSDPKVIFLRETKGDSLFEGDLAALYHKILASLKYPQEKLATMEWSKSSNEILQKIQEVKPHILFALGSGAQHFLEGKSNELKSFVVINSHDPSEIGSREELKRLLWNDLKNLMKHLELS
jgi:hypothetical protein